mmetsp:Transcript_15726/g.46579  ORF Transcript_15726/g.46579 Transcript_15726/m.46579 type:complete len:284 (+) Transcript_15726:3309-4160(+)
MPVAMSCATEACRARLGVVSPASSSSSSTAIVVALSCPVSAMACATMGAKFCDIGDSDTLLSFSAASSVPRLVASSTAPACGGSSARSNWVTLGRLRRSFIALAAGNGTPACTRSSTSDFCASCDVVSPASARSSRAAIVDASSWPVIAIAETTTGAKARDTDAPLPSSIRDFATEPQTSSCARTLRAWASGWVKPALVSSAIEALRTSRGVRMLPSARDFAIPSVTAPSSGVFPVAATSKGASLSAPSTAVRSPLLAEGHSCSAKRTRRARTAGRGNPDSTS